MDSTEIAKNRLSDFIKEMNAWEIECGRIEDENIDEAKQFELQKKMLEDIFTRYCTDKKRLNGRPNTVSYGEEGSFDYNPKDEKIVDTNEEKDKNIDNFPKGSSYERTVCLHTNKKGKSLVVGLEKKILYVEEKVGSRFFIITCNNRGSFV